MKSLLNNLCSGILICGLLLITPNTASQTPVKQTIKPNEPIGTPRGVYPGRVVWCHAPGTATWDGYNDNWFYDTYNSQDDCDWLIDMTICNLTGAENVRTGWDKIFKHFNLANGKGDTPYKNGEIITIKINNNNTDSHTDNNDINASPQMVFSLLRSLTQDAGIPQECIVVAEPSRFITDYLYNKCHKAFPDVRFVDNIGGDGREKSEYLYDVMHYSKDNGQLATGIATVFTDASYVINMALLKGHVGQGVTLCGKNWYGAMSIHADWRKNFHDNFNQNRNGKPQYITFVDFMGHESLGGKCILWLIDGLYGCRNVGGAPGPRWQMQPFNGDWPSSLFGSLDPVAIDMVGLDFLTNEFSDLPDADYSDMYLAEAALADNPPSGTNYNPSGTGSCLHSLGVAEHWNNKEEKRYLGTINGVPYGIDLVYICRKNINQP